MNNELALISAFVKRNKRERYREMLADARHRRRFTTLLAHFVDFDPKFRALIPSAKLSIESAARELRKRTRQMLFS